MANAAKRDLSSYDVEYGRLKQQMGWNSPEASDADLSGDEEHRARNGNDSENNNSDHGEYDDSESNDGSENNNLDDKSEI